MESKGIGIKIKTLDNTLHEFTITKEMSVSDLKNKIFDVKKLNIVFILSKSKFQLIDKELSFKEKF